MRNQTTITLEKICFKLKFRSDGASYKRGSRAGSMASVGDLDERETRMRNLRFCIAYQELALLLPADDGEDDDAAWSRRLFREELAGFHQLVVNNVTHEDVVVHARASLRLAWEDCVADEQDVANENWARTGPEDIRVGVVNDLQLMAPGIWIGSTDTLTYADLLDENGIQHLVYCTTTTNETRVTREEDSSRSPLRSQHVVTLFDLPRQQFEDMLTDVDGVEQLKALSSASCSEIIRIASALNELIGARSAAEDPRNPRAPGDSGMLLYCDSGISASIALCAALLMTRYKLPLAVAMPLIRAARRDIFPSKHLHFQLEQLDLNFATGLPS